MSTEHVLKPLWVMSYAHWISCRCHNYLMLSCDVTMYSKSRAEMNHFVASRSRVYSWGSHRKKLNSWGTAQYIWGNLGNMLGSQAGAGVKQRQWKSGPHIG